MKNKFLTTLLAATACFVLFFNGVIRDDVPIEEYLKLGAQKQFDCAADIRVESGSVASGVLVSDRYVLTAAHIAIESDTRPKTVDLGEGKTATINEQFNQRVREVTGLFVQVNGQTVAAKKFILHPDYLADPSKSQCDIMLIELEKPIKGVKPAKLNNVFDEKGYNVVGVGFGVTGKAGDPNSVIGRPDKKLAGENVIDSIGGSKYKGQHVRLFCDFDHPTRTDCNSMGSATPRPLEYVCGGGDSGGGLFREKNGKWEVVGVCKGVSYNMQTFSVTGYYGQEMRWTRVAVFYDWIQEVIK